MNLADANVWIYADRPELTLHSVARTRLAELAEGAEKSSSAALGPDAAQSRIWWNVRIGLCTMQDVTNRICGDGDAGILPIRRSRVKESR